MSAYNLSQEGSLWMGDVAEYMTETFIKAAFKAMDETVVGVKFIRNKFTGNNAGYCFVHFKDKPTALRIMHKLNGKMIPNSHPPTRFMLNHSNLGKSNEREFSVWVGDLDKSVDDSQLYMAFASRYSSVVAARVVTDRQTGVSRGYAFIRFSSEQEHKDALTHMNGFNGLANKPIRVCLAVPRKPVSSSDGPPAAAAPTGDGGDYNAYYEQYWYNYQAWHQNYAQYDGSGYQAQGYQGYEQSAQPAAAVSSPAAGAAAPSTAVATPDADAQDDDDQVEEHDLPADLDGQNQEFVRRSEEFWDALDASRWLQPDTLNPALELFIKT